MQVHVPAHVRAHTHPMKAEKSVHRWARERTEGETNFALASPAGTLRLCTSEAQGQAPWAGLALLTGSYYIRECSRLKQSRTLMTVSAGRKKIWPSAQMSGREPSLHDRAISSTFGEVAACPHAPRDGGHASSRPSSSGGRCG